MDALLAAVLTVAGLLEVLRGLGRRRATGSSARVAVACATLPLALAAAAHPLLPVAAVALALLGRRSRSAGFLVGQMATPVVELAIALYSAGPARRDCRAALAGAAVARRRVRGIAGRVRPGGRRRRARPC